MNASLGVSSPEPGSRIRLKPSAGWFAAGERFETALLGLSDGAFRLFAYLCLKAERSDGSIQIQPSELSRILHRSRRSVGVYLHELEEKGVCQLRRGANQYTLSRVVICDAYWPYERSESASREPAGQAGDPGTWQQTAPRDPLTLPGETDREIGTQGTQSTPTPWPQYRDAVREAFIAVGCTQGLFRPSDEATTRHFYERGIPLAVVEEALLLGATRKYVSRLNGGSPDLITTLHYFEPLVEEILDQPLPSGYRPYLQRKLDQYRKEWIQRCKIPPEVDPARAEGSEVPSCPSNDHDV